MILAALVTVIVTASFPLYPYGTWVMIDAEMVSWDALVYCLKIIFPGLVLNTVLIITWMLPRLFQQLNGPDALHATLDLQAYATLIFALTGIVRIFQTKWKADLYHNSDQDVSLDDLRENMGTWRGRLRVGIFGYVTFWVFAQLLGIYRHLSSYVLG